MIATTLLIKEFEKVFNEMGEQHQYEQKLLDDYAERMNKKNDPLINHRQDMLNRRADHMNLLYEIACAIVVNEGKAFNRGVNFILAKADQNKTSDNFVEKASKLLIINREELRNAHNYQKKIEWQDHH